MNILAIETSSKLCGICLCKDKKIIDKLEINNGLTHSETLMPLIKKLLEKNNINISNIDAFVCDIGPGSFTGIRIGVATAIAFVDSSNSAKYTGVSSLEALSYNIKENGYIASVIDCKNNNCYYALFKLENENYSEIIPPTASTIIEMLEKIKQTTNEKVTFVGDGSEIYKKEIENIIDNSIFADENLNILNTINIALAGFKKIETNTTLPLTPLYLKKPQAERQLEESLKSKIKKVAI